ncbi:V-type proton ATPase subunit G 1 isoform 2 [Schistosoma japonicum]|uniref:V-type proton ATPase subunit G n=1 Tax=Schistosoma japonicum TaxID=6182 RepID=Q5DAN6_SCHJA|nr:SJCHGC09080 protein [Schistosoma japonicum]KAH8860381.1 ATPase [Schistosoma japonicum]TNN11650.1 V-type proton ATPase subunit G 1 isoform 2 [Schistosoma japonicum]CAX75578.1 ATPase, H+ transporting, lysosomal 13kDa, V1 subunit G1 [Schistosoma japonicum]CAX75579.1 ATPase, H+ transporting, lysosomal 13kDa, V1 subunit G1 [Schistosoma japonicum]
MSAVAVQSDGVAKLQQARTAALAKIEEARNRRAKRLKEAKGEANLEIEAFKSQQEAHYNSLELQVNSQYGPHEEICNKMTIEQLDLLQRSFQSNKNKALQLLLSKVLDVKPVVHVNFGFKSPGSQ